MPKIKSVKPVGRHQTFDLEIDHPDHQFYLANGVLTSNSHAVSYAIDSYQCAWLLTYFEPEWLCAYIESQSSKPDSRAAAIRELKSFGYEIAQIDINYAETGWTILEGKRFVPSFKSIKSIGDAAIEEIMKYRPYKTLETFLWSDDQTWKHSKFNKRALESLIKINGFGSMDIVGPGKLFENYKQMHWVLIENMQALKHKKTGHEALARLIKESKNIPDWTRLEKIEATAELLGNLDIDVLVPEKLQTKLRDKKIASIDECVDAGGICWFIVNQATIKKAKNGKDYLLLVVSAGVSQTHRLYCWSWTGGMLPQQFDVFLGELSKTQFGFSTNASKIRKLNLDEIEAKQ